MVKSTGSVGLTIDGAVLNTSALTASADNLTVTGNVTGSGSATIADSATSTFDARVAAGQQVTFAGQRYRNACFGPGAGFAGTVAGLVDGGAIDLETFAYSASATKASITSVTSSDGDTIVTMKDGNLTAAIAPHGAQYGTSPGDYALSSDHRAGKAGTLFELAAPVGGS